MTSQVFITLMPTGVVLVEMDIDTAAVCSNTTAMFQVVSGC